MPNCPECNFPYEEGQRFCNTCGAKLPVVIKQKVCPVCGNTLLENTKMCSICGTPVSAPEDTTAAEELARQQEALKNPTMDEVEIPIITDDMLNAENEQPRKEDLPTMDSVEMPGVKPKPKPVQIVKPAGPIGNTDPVTVQFTKPQAAPQPMAGPGSAPQVPPTPVVPPTPQVQNTYQQPQNPYQQTAQPQPVIPPQGGYQQQPIIPGINNPQQNNMPRNNMPMNNIPQNGVTPGKSANNIVPIILAIAIVIVILLDVFVLFRKQIFGDKDKGSAKENASIVTVMDDIDLN